MPSSAPSTPSNAARMPLSPRSSNVTPDATSPRDFPSSGNIGNIASGSISRMVNQTVAPSPASIKKKAVQHIPNPRSPSSSSAAATTIGIASIDPQSIQQSNTTFTHVLTQLSNLNQTGKYLSAHDILVQNTTSGQRAVLWPILKHKVEALPTFPEAGEDDGLCLLRESERVFGQSLKRLVEVEGNAGNSSEGFKQISGNISAGPMPVDDMMSPNETAQSDHWQQQNSQYEEQRQGRYQDIGYQQQDEEYNGYQRRDYNNGAEQYYDDGGYQSQQLHGNGQGRRDTDEREAFDYSRIDDARQQNYPHQNAQQWQNNDGRQYIPPNKFHEANGGGRGGGGSSGVVPGGFQGQESSRWQNGHQHWNGPSSNRSTASRFDYSERGDTRSGYQDDRRSPHGNREPGWRQDQQYEEQSQYNSQPPDHHLSTRHDHDGESHYTNYQVNGGNQGQTQYQGHESSNERNQYTPTDAHSVRSRFSKTSRSMFGQSFVEEHEVNSKRRQDLFEEMEHTSRILRSTTNDEVRQSHMRHLKSLRDEWEQLKGLASPTKSTLETKDGHIPTTDRTIGERSGKSSAANTSNSSMRDSSGKKIAKKLWRGEQILLRDPNDGHGGGMADDKSIGLKSARSMATNARSIFDDDATTVATAPASRPMGKRTVNVVAPEALPAGFAFEARLGDHVFMATVPEGGVSKGEVFASVINDIDKGADKASVRVRTLLDMGGSKQRWRDELLDCFTEGFFHPLICNSIFCPQIALTQIMARMQMTSLGERGITLNSRFKVNQTIWLTVGVILVHILYAVPVVVRSPQNVGLYVISFLPLMAMDLGLVIYFWYLVARTRKAMRDEYDIPQMHCKCGCAAEDACMAVFCSACTLSQMGRHTADYTTYRSMCCTDTGLPNHVEVKLPSDPMNEMV